MSNVLAEIRSWATALPYWEQAALDKLVSGAPLADSDYDELLQYLLEDGGLLQPSGARPVLRFPQARPEGERPPEPVRLVSISGLQHVNALVPGQTLTFSPALTAIYGANGSGKSGYARVLACAGFTRGDQEVLPDVTKPIAGNPTITADITIAHADGQQTIRYEVGKPCPSLSSFYVFDSTSVRVHLTKENVLSFSPAGLSYLTQLVAVTDRVRERLQQRVVACSQPRIFAEVFPGDSSTKAMINTLGPDTNLNELRSMALLTPEQQARLAELDLEIARLKVQNTSGQIADIDKTLCDLRALSACLRSASAGFDDAHIAAINAATNECVSRKATAQRLSVDEFRSPSFTQTGSETWMQFLRAAKTLASAEQTVDGPYPQEGSACLLCSQPLSAAARDLLVRLWAFLEGTAQVRLQEAQQALEAQQAVLTQADLDFFEDQSVCCRYLSEHNPQLAARIKAFVLACCQRREVVQRDPNTLRVETLSPLPGSGVPEVGQIIVSLQAEREALSAQDTSQEIAQREKERMELEHRRILAQHLHEIESYLQTRMWASKATKLGGTTRHITAKHSELFRLLVTDRYVELFQERLRQLGRPLQVGIGTSGKKGQTFKQIVLVTCSSTDKTPVDQVLSEGEKRAVALADFLTEAALDTASSGIILDDPVTSLDLQWRETIAALLLAETNHRQVIVFTHDMPFLYYLIREGGIHPTEIQTHWIKRGDSDGQPGYVFLDNCPALERQYRKPDKAASFCKRAKDAPSAEEQESLLRQGFGALRATYEAFIIFDLLGEVVMRFDERISFGRLKDIVWDRELVQEVIAKCEFLSRHIEGHLHSDEYVERPTPVVLQKEIDGFRDIRKRHGLLGKQSC